MFGLLTTGMVKSPEDQMALVAETLFPKEWLDGVAGDEDGEWRGKTRREMVEAVRLIDSATYCARGSLLADWVERRIY